MKTLTIENAQQITGGVDSRQSGTGTTTEGKEFVWLG